MEQYTVTGMSCAACSARVEKAVSKVSGVTACSVSLLTNSMGVEGSAAAQDIISAVEAAGYGASLKSKGGEPGADGATQAAEPEDAEAALQDRETPLLKKRLWTSVIFLVILMYFSMGHMMWGWKLPSFLEGNHVAMGIIQMLLTIVIMVINRQFFVSGVKSLLRSSQHGYAGVIGSGGCVRLQYLCAVCHDGCPDERKCRGGHVLYA